MWQDMISNWMTFALDAARLGRETQAGSALDVIRASKPLRGMLFQKLGMASLRRCPFFI
jgi:hypothetical protein